jgi:glutathione S-transferase
MLPEELQVQGHAMAEYQLYCFAQSGNAYRAALMLNLIGADWEPLWVDFFGKGETRSPQYRTNVNEMGEVPVLAYQGKKLSQSAVILTYLAERSGKFRPESEDERLEALRWIIFDNQKVNGFLGPYRFLRCFAKPPGDPAAHIPQGPHRQQHRHRRQAALEQAFRPRGAPDYRRSFAGRLSLLSGGGIRLRHRHPAQEHRGLARPHQGAAGLEAPLRSHAGAPAAGLTPSDRRGRQNRLS